MRLSHTCIRQSIVNGKKLVTRGVTISGFQGEQIVWSRLYIETTQEPYYECSQCSMGGDTSRAGLPSKKPEGFIWKPTVSTGITGQSSGRTTWFEPKVYQTTRSVFSRDLFFWT